MASKHPAVSTSDEERTTVDPGALDSWVDERTVADSPSTSTTDVVPDDDTTDRRHQKEPRPPNGLARAGEPAAVIVNRSAVGSESETVDEATIEEGRANLKIPGPPVPKLPHAVLVIRTGPHEGQSFTLRKASTTIGRGLNNDIVLADLSISRKHLAITYDGDAFCLQDLQSGNGTIVNGRDEDNRYRLLNRDALELGRSIITFECEAMKAKKPSIAPPQPRGAKPSGKPTARPTVSMRSSGEHPEFEVDVDEDARTIAGQRPPGLDLPAVAKKSTQRGPKLQGAPRDLVMPRDPRPSGRPRMTVASPAVPAPRPHEPAVRHNSERPTIARPSQSPPIIAPVSLALDEEEPRRLPNPPRRVVEPVRERHPSVGAPLPRPHPSSAPPPRPNVGSTPPRPNVGSTPPRPGNSSMPPSVVYPAAPAQFNRSGAVVALSPRAPHAAGSMRPVDAPQNRRWIAGIALLAVATVVGVTIAAISGNDGSSSTEQTAAVPVATPAPDAGPTVTPLKTADAGSVPDVKEISDPVQPAPIKVTLAPSELGTSETVLIGLPQASRTGPDPAGDKPDKPDPAVDKPDKPDPAVDKPDKPDPAVDKPDPVSDKEKDKAFVKKTKSRALAAYRDRSFRAAASLSRQAAARASKRDARGLRKRADDLSSLQKLLSGAKSAADIPAYNSYRAALKVDGRLGKKHISFINALLRGVAPKAARSYMVKGDYSKAATAVTISRKLGATAATDNTMRSLERKAAPLLKSGKAAAKRGDDDDARADFKKAKSILPRQSKLYSDVRELINDL